MKNNSVDIFSLVKKFDIKLSKALGQNFLIDNNIVYKIIESADIGKKDLVIEVGPGAGSLTNGLCDSAGYVIAVEIDKKLIPVLNEKLSSCNNIEILNKDILKTDIREILSDFPQYETYKVVANLPYYITTSIIMRFLESERIPDVMVIMMQKEVADRILAAPGSKEYGSLSVAVNFYCNSKRVMNVSPNCFMPKPEVISTVLKLEKRNNPAVKVISNETFFKTVRAAFAQRRKKAVNSISNTLNIKRECIEKAFDELGLNREKRAEQFSIEEFGALSDKIYGIIDLTS